MAADNKSLGRFRLEGIPPAPRGVPKIQVTFDIDVNGILKVTAKDEATGKSTDVTIRGHGGLGEQEIQRMVRDAEAHAEEDKRRQELIEARNGLDALVYNAEKTLRDLGPKVDGAKAAAVREQVEKCNGVKAGEDVAAIRRETEALQQALLQIGAAMYEGSEGQGAAPEGAPGPDAGPGEAAGGGGAPGGRVVDADYDVGGGA